MINKFSGFLNTIIKSKLDKDTKKSILKGIEYFLEHTQVEGTRDGIKVTFKKKI